MATMANDDATQKQKTKNDDSLRTLFSGSAGTKRKNLEITPDITPVASIKVIGVGGGGGNAINRMIKSNVRGIDFIAVNTDAQALYHSEAPVKINIGKATTRGLGAGSHPEIGKQSAEESSEEIKQTLEGADMVFITCGLGGGTGTGGSPVVAEVAKELGILTTAVVTKPFLFEGSKRAQNAEAGLKELRKNVDAIITIDKNRPWLQALSLANDVLRQAIKGISDLILVPGLINHDFADIRAIMAESGR